MKKSTKTKAYSSKSTRDVYGGVGYTTNKAFKATKSGKLISERRQEFPTLSGKASTFEYATTSLDTTGYSKGKKSFPAKKTTYNPFDTDLLTGEQLGVKTERFDVPRSKVKKTIKEMKSNTGMLQKDKKANATKKVTKPASTKTIIDRNGKKTTKVFKPVAVNKSEAFRKGGKKLHLGFKEAQAKIAKKQGISMEAAGAILASSARKASPAAVKKNPALLNVKRGKVKKYGDGGKTIKKVPANRYAKEQIFNLKKGSEEAKAAYVATNSGTVYQIKYPKSSNRASVLSMDTTGYSKGKPSYKLDFENGKRSVISKTVKRKDVKPLLKNMKKEVTSMRKGGKKK